MITLVLALLAIGSASGTTEELLQCRANLTADIRNEDVFANRVKLADYVFTGKIADMSLARRLIRVKVKRTIKGQLDDVGLLELQVNDTCAAYIRPSYTGIFMGRVLPGATRTWMHFGPVPLTLANLDRVNAAIKGIKVVGARGWFSTGSLCVYKRNQKLKFRLGGWSTKWNFNCGGIT